MKEREITEQLLWVQKHEVRFIAAMQIQAVIRGFLVRNRIDRCHARALARSYVLQMHMLRELRHVERMEYQWTEAMAKIEQNERAATKIQARVRANQARLLYEAEMAGRHALAIRVQKLYRGHSTRKQTELDRQRQAHDARMRDEIENIAALTIQTHVRRIYSDRFLAFHIAATIIQCAIRHFLARNRVARENSEHLSACIIQATVRGVYLRQQHQQQRAEMKRFSEAAITIQSMFRGHHSRLRTKVMKESFCRAVTKIPDIRDLTGTTMKIKYPEHEALAYPTAPKLSQFPWMKSKHQESTLENRVTSAADCDLNDGTAPTSSHDPVFTKPTPPLNSRPKDCEMSPRAAPTSLSSRSISSSCSSSSSSRSFPTRDDASALLPLRLLKLYEAFSETPDYAAGRIEIMDESIIQSLGLDFASLKLELETSQDRESVLAALDGLTVLVHTRAKFITARNLCELGAMISKRMKQAQVWNRDVAIASCWLLREYHSFIKKDMNE